MSVDTVITLPNNVRVRDVATVMGLLAGLPGEWSYYNGERLAYECPGATPENRMPSIPECCEILLRGPMVDGTDHHDVMFHFEFSVTGEGQDKGLCPHSTAFWIAIGTGLIRFFGGTICYQDTTDNLDEIVLEKHNICPHDGELWMDFQEREIDHFQQYAAYK